MAKGNPWEGSSHDPAGEGQRNFALPSLSIEHIAFLELDLMSAELLGPWIFSASGI
jgi:hypothetical protein